MKTIISIQPISEFIYKIDYKVRTEIEYYSDGTNTFALAAHYKK